MSTYLYFSMTPESLVASMVPPEEFGTYLAIGTRKSAHGEAIFFDLREDFRSECFDRAYVTERCVPHPDGQPKHSLYLAVYRVLERIPLEALNSLWLVTAKGKVLELKRSKGLPEFADKYYLYQEICPVHPLVVSAVGPREFCAFITDPRHPISVPRICFTCMEMGQLAVDPEHGNPSELYYPDHFWHLRECLMELNPSQGKLCKTVDRLHPAGFPYHFIKNGFFVGDQQQILYYPFPSRGELEGKYYYWWRRSAH